MERSLVYEIEKNIAELSDSTYPTNAPQDASGPYLVYLRMGTEEDKTYDGFSGDGSLSFMFSIMAQRYETMKDITDRVTELIKSWLMQTIGGENSVYVKNVTINNVSEVWESELKVNRGIIDFTIDY